MIGSPASRGAVASVGGAGRACLRRGVGGQRRQCGHRRERHNGGRPPTPHRHGGLRRRQSIYHAMPRLKCLSALASITCQMRSLDQENRRHHPPSQFASGDIRHAPRAAAAVRPPLGPRVRQLLPTTQRKFTGSPVRRRRWPCISIRNAQPARATFRRTPPMSAYPPISTRALTAGRVFRQIARLHHFSPFSLPSLVAHMDFQAMRSGWLMCSAAPSQPC